MPSQKLPLFDGIITPVHNGNLNAGDLVATIPLVVFSPPDKALTPVGLQGTYEVHLWIRPANINYAGASSERYTLRAYLDGDPATTRTIWSGSVLLFGDLLFTPPIKILDGYPVRGNVTIELLCDVDAVGGLDAYPSGIQAWGYSYRVGQGTLIQPERRFIGEESPDGITSGMPILLESGDRTILHTFEEDRIDEISLAFNSIVADAAVAPFITFEDVNNNPIIAGHSVIFGIYPTSFNSLKDPQSVYWIYQVPMGGGYLPTLDHIAVELPAQPPASTVFVHGYFTRR